MKSFGAMVFMILYSLGVWARGGELVNLYVPFDRSMGVTAGHEYSGLLRVFKNVYEQQSFAKKKLASHVKIPKIIHHIWLGGALPQEYEQYYASWLQYHPEWRFVFWTDTKSNYGKGACIVNSFDELAHTLAQGNEQCIVVDVSNLVFDNRLFFDQTVWYGERSDILRYEILHRIGGLYVDIDFECLKAFDPLHYVYDLYIGVQPLDTGCVQLGIGLIGAVPRHYMLEHAVTSIKKYREQKMIICKTGPIHFTRSFCACIGKKNTCDIVFPSSYFYPMGYTQKGLDQGQWHRNESFAVHHWAGSWINPEAICR